MANETQYNGPLDIAREIAVEIDELDEFTTDLLLECPEAEADIKPMLDNINARHPLIGQQVIAYGTPLTISIEGYNVYPFVLPPDKARQEGEFRIPHGAYEGLSLCHVYDCDTDIRQAVLAHTLDTGTGEQELIDELGNKQQMLFYDYVLLDGSEITPMLPFNAHSYRDLADDRVAAEVDKLATDDSLSPAEKLRALGFVNQALARLEGQDEMNHQRVSYINSLGFLEGVKLLINDMIITKTDDPTNILYMSQPAEPPIALRPNMLTIAPGYERLSISQAPLMGGPPELYARITLADDQAMLAPLKNVVGIQTID